jgi:ketosteroid isomerase-like protein
MKRIIIALAGAVLAGGVATASDQAEVMATVRGFVDAFNKGDVKAVAATCAEQTSIIDEFPPHEWHGMGACAKWMADYDTDAKKNAITDGVVTLGAPRHTDVAGETAYVVVSADYTFKQAGKPVKETGSILTIALKKNVSGWRMTGWSWAKN